jgi:hypothetical protein
MLHNKAFRFTGMKHTIEMFGLSPFAETNAVDIDLQDNAGIEQLIEALGKAMPSFRGRVIQEERNSLVENYGLYINGQFISDDQDVRIKPGDRIVLILLATGG